MRLIDCLCCVSLALVPFKALGLDIVKDGQAKAIIVSPDHPSPVVRYAIKEFQDHLEKASGVRLDVVNEASADGDSRNKVYIGAGAASEKAGLPVLELPDNEFYVSADETSLFLVGKDGQGVPPFDDSNSMGSLFAVYHWLDTRLGAKWLWPGDVGTVVPKTSNIDGGPPGKETHKSPLLHTKLRYGGGPIFGAWQGVMTAKEREKFLFDTAVWLRRHRFARPTSFEYGHGFNHYWHRFGAKHPDWFALGPDGKRGPVDGAEELVQMCVSSPGLHDTIIADWLEQRKRDVSLPWINGAENDKRAEDPSCHCEICRAWDPKNNRTLGQNDPFLFDSKAEKETVIANPSLSDRYAKFWLALQAKGRKYDDKATVVGYAYADYSEPPLETKLNERILVWIVPPYVYPLNKAEQDRFEALWKGWAKTGARLVLRPNYTLMGAGLPYVYARQFGKDFQYAAKHGLIGTDFDSLTSMWGVQGPNLYMLGRLSEKPEMDIEAVLNEYYSGFGAAAPFAREYFDRWERITSERVNAELLKTTPDAMWAGLYLEGAKVYRPEDLAAAQTILKNAAAAVPPGSPESERVAFLQKGLDHTKISFQTVDAFKGFLANPDDQALKEGYLAQLRKLDAFRKTIASDNVVDLVFLNFLEERAGFGRKQIELDAGKEVAVALPLFWQFQWDPQGTGTNEGWFRGDSDRSNWLQVRTDKSWKDQPVGEEWIATHGSDFSGSAWYQVDFQVPESYKGRKLYLSFGAVDEGGDFWLNDKVIARRKFDPVATPNLWQEAFLVDVSNAVEFGRSNSLVVRVDKNHGGAGGIWKRVNVLVE